MHTRFQLRKANILEVGYVMLMTYFLKGMISLFMGNSPFGMSICYLYFLWFLICMKKWA
jgi:hypothetical protein